MLRRQTEHLPRDGHLYRWHSARDALQADKVLRGGCIQRHEADPRRTRVLARGKLCLPGPQDGEHHVREACPEGIGRQHQADRLRPLLPLSERHKDPEGCRDAVQCGARAGDRPGAVRPEVRHLERRGGDVHHPVGPVPLPGEDQGRAPAQHPQGARELQGQAVEEDLQGREDPARRDAPQEGGDALRDHPGLGAHLAAGGQCLAGRQHHGGRGGDHEELPVPQHAPEGRDHGARLAGQRRRHEAPPANLRGLGP
mmetsp:Transcript_10121/g.29978  ORF Transcript_10121/g.29978 Transcript_10121/m.29978 type:complete len:255 (+) Transcript_10121:546-1310(+)